MEGNLFFDLKDMKYLGSNVKVGKIVNIVNPASVEIVRNNVIIDDYTYINGNVKVGDFSYIGPFCLLSTKNSKVIIGSFVGISPRCKLYASTSDYLIPSLDSPTIPDNFRYGGVARDINMSDNVVIGANSVALPGCDVPEGTAFAAGSIVVSKKKYEPWSLYYGDCSKPRYKRDYKKYIKVVEKIRKYEG
jgi:galactoside O-acetyltransferase